MRECSTPNYLSHVLCQVSGVLCQMSCVRCHVSGVKLVSVFFFDKGVELVGGGSVINGT